MPEANAADPTVPNCKKVRREDPLRLHRAWFSIYFLQGLDALATKECFRQAPSTGRKHHNRIDVLEDDLQSQLHVERFARPDARSAVVVADGIRGNSQTAAGQASAIALQG